MNVRFLGDSGDFRSYGGGTAVRNKPSSGLFWWTIFITLLIGLTVFSWFFCIFVFSHPEKPFSYRLLAKVKKLDPIRRFSQFTVPQGKFLNAREALGEYFNYTEDQLAVTNDLLKRAYIRNYKEQAPQYLKGEFNVIASRPLGASDVFTTGMVVRTRAADFEDVDVEIVLPGAGSASHSIAAGDKIMLNQKSTFASVIHVQKLQGDRVCVSVVPLAYQGFSTGEGQPLVLKEPDLLNMEAAWPIAGDLDKPVGVDGESGAKPGAQKVAAQTEP